MGTTGNKLEIIFMLMIWCGALIISLAPLKLVKFITLAEAVILIFLLWKL